jgi:hypothetical protein
MDTAKTLRIIPDGYRGFASNYLKNKHDQSISDILATPQNSTDKGPDDLLAWAENQGRVNTPNPAYGFKHVSDISTCAIRVNSIRRFDMELVPDKSLVLGVYERDGRSTRDTHVRVTLMINHVFYGSSEYADVLFGTSGHCTRSVALKSAYLLCTFI